MSTVLPRVRRLLSLLAITLLVGYAIFPLVWTFLTSFKPERDILATPIQYLPSTWTTINYRDLWAHSDFPSQMMNSAVVTITTVSLVITVGGLAAYSLSRSRFRGRGSVMVFFLSIRMFPFVMMLIPLFVILRTIGLLDSRTGLALSYATFTLPIAIWLLKNFFDNLPPEIEDAARVDGANRLRLLWHIALPLTRSGLAATAILIAISAWNEFLFALLLTSSSGSRTWPVGLQLMVGDFRMPFGQLAAAAVITILPIILAYALAGRTLVRGLMSGGLKG